MSPPPQLYTAPLLKCLTVLVNMDKSEVGVEWGQDELFQCIMSCGVTASLKPYLFCINDSVKLLLPGVPLLFGDIITVASLATNNQHSLVIVLGCQVLHRRMRQDNLLGVDLLNMLKKSIPPIALHNMLPWHPPAHWSGVLFLPQ